MPDAKVLYWTGAWINMVAIVVLMAYGVHSIRQGNVVRHKRLMLSAFGLVVAFLVSYPVKLVSLGRENLAVWEDWAVRSLQFHEACIAVMLLGAFVALACGFAMREKVQVTRNPEDASAPASTVAWHRRAGWSAVVGAGFGLASAGLVLVGMYGRS